MRLFLSAGEASGDAYAAALADACASQGFQPEGIGGPKLRAAGAITWADSSAWGAIGVLQAIRVGFQVMFGSLKAKRALQKGVPGIFVPIDFGFVNIRLCRVAKRAGWKVLYFIPPGSWKRGPQGKDLAEVTDAVVTPFPWSAEVLKSNGVNAFWFGHPLLDLSVEDADVPAFSVAIFPGSRKHEIHANLPILAKALRDEDVALFGVAPNLSLAEMEGAWAQLAPGRTSDHFVALPAPAILRHARRAIVCSGTTTLQAAIAKVPMVLIYGLTPMMALEGKVLGLEKKLKFVGLPNILLDKAIVPELVALKLTFESLRAALASLDDPSVRAAQLAGFEELLALLGEPGCIAKTASLIGEMAGQG